jgi:hypothetical protein
MGAAGNDPRRPRSAFPLALFGLAAGAIAVCAGWLTGVVLGDAQPIVRTAAMVIVAVGVSILVGYLADPVMDRLRRRSGRPS